MFVVTNIMCRDKHKFYCDKGFVTASILLSRQKTCFVATKMILGAAPANDNYRCLKRARLPQASKEACDRMQHAVGLEVSEVLLNN